MKIRDIWHMEVAFDVWVASPKNGFVGMSDILYLFSRGPLDGYAVSHTGMPDEVLAIYRNRKYLYYQYSAQIDIVNCKAISTIYFVLKEIV